MTMIVTCEDSLCQLVELAFDKIAHSDKKILKSISTQLKKRNLALTDRQYELVQIKLLEYKDTFDTLGIDITSSIKNLKMPLREIDRSHYVRFEDYKDKPYIVIRFPFTKKIIDRLEEIRRIDKDRKSFKQEHKHYFPANEKYVFKLVEIAKRFDAKFEISQEVMDYYNELLDFENNKKDYLPGIYDNKIYGLPANAIEYLHNTLGEPSEDNLFKYYDRRHLYGLGNIENVNFSNVSHLTKLIAERTTNTVNISPKTFTLSAVVETLFELNRLPLLVTLNSKTPLDDLGQIHNLLRNLVDSKDQSVLCRTSNNELPEFNDYIRNNNLNNSVAQNTKIVYIMNNKLPKPLLQSDWMPAAVLGLNFTLSQGKVSMYANTFDLTVYFDEVANNWYNYTSKQHIEKIG